MTWEGSIYRQESGDYRISVTYSAVGEFCTIRCKGKIIGYETDMDDAKAFCEAHSNTVSPTAASAAGV